MSLASRISVLLLLGVCTLSPAISAAKSSAAKLPILRVATDGSATYKTVQSAIDAAPESGGAIIVLAPGTYREVLHITKPGIQLRSTNKDASKTVITFNNSAGTAGGTSKSSSVFVDGDDFVAENITIGNDYDYPHLHQNQGSQAVALRITGDRAWLHNVRLLGYQDTLYTISHKCSGEGDSKRCEPARQYFSESYIEGNVDFIFGDGKSVFDHCEIHSNGPGYLTAQSKLYADEDSGYLIYQSKLTAEPGIANVSLGRPWRPYSSVTYIETAMGAHIMAAGWNEWSPGKTTSLETATYQEFGSTGPGAQPKARDPHSHQLTSEAAKHYTPSEFLKGNDNWDPVHKQLQPIQ